MTDKLAFSGSLEYVTYCIEKYLVAGYMLTSFHHTNNEKFGKIIFVEMEKDNVSGKPVNCLTDETHYPIPPASIPGKEILGNIGTWTLQEQLEEAIELEDYEEAARLRDLINKV